MNSFICQGYTPPSHKPTPPDSSITFSSWTKRFFPRLLGEERAANVLALISILVLLLHYGGLLFLQHPVKQIDPAKPQPMEVLIIPVKAPKLNVAPPPPPPTTAKKPLPKKLQPKPTLKKVPIDLQQPSDFAPTKQVLEPQPVEETTPSPTTPAIESEATTTKFEPFSQADMSASYAHNPKPDYPTIAKIRGWQGEVLLRVHVSEQGISDLVEVQRSSGFDALDESAIEAVKQWLFTPAKYGAEPVASSVIVPIVFTLNDHKQV
ncbi:energy transducer TonB [Methylomonas sp. AM2-LC]|uniref:energy transducer TonB n=1 Tax=Methylomonas sp. AM2-LC TaxID=3153301 RepID=UPI003267DE34